MLDSSLDGLNGTMLRAFCLQYIPLTLGDLYVSVFLATGNYSVNARYFCAGIC